MNSSAYGNKSDDQKREAPSRFRSEEWILQPFGIATEERKFHQEGSREQTAQQVRLTKTASSYHILENSRKKAYEKASG